ncbi:MAG: D-glycero-beta-D-manno-heptose-7-phosphate kinase [Desulfamplus sp.]|nr:D-glycero-beta-D-manno-heptose-7-phosphate kinase [Desulfamplus sp.]MBF0258300.1 D-glycero-beta-D-manno-heptose-7-phosphate kinase [Desulfamplus sp.]
MKINLDDFVKSRILVIGDIMLDCYLWGKVERISPEAPVPIVQTLKRTYMLGGAGNVALNLASLGCQSDILAICGNDRAGSQLKEMLAENNINSRLITADDHLTISKTRIMALDQQLLRIDEERIQMLKTELQESLLAQIKDIIPAYNAVILSDYGKGLLQTPEMTESVISMCKESNIYVLVDPKGRDWKRYQYATCVTPNSAELNLVANEIIESEAELISVSQRIKTQYSLEWLLVTRGSKGMCLTSGESKSPLLIPTQARQVYDVSGAGDTVIAVLAAGISIGLSFQDAAILANKAAGVVVGKVGTQPITRQELEEALLR